MFLHSFRLEDQVSLLFLSFLFVHELLELTILSALSVPVYFSQSPWSLKPPPRLDRSSVESLAAATLHFDAQIELYGRQVIVNLAEAKGPESIVVDAYRQAVTDMNKSREEGKCQVRYVEFDFHSECKGMKYENISSRLLPQLESDLDELRSWWSSDGTVLSKQTGVVRTNCMDCEPLSLRHNVSRVSES